MADISKISPDNGTTIYDLKDIEARKRVSEVLLKDTVGWVGKNLLVYPYESTTKTENGVTITNNGNGSLTLNGTATANIDYTLNNQNTGNREALLGKTVILSTNSVNGVLCREWGAETADTARSEVGKLQFSFNNASGTYTIGLRLSSGATFSNITVYPMLRDASIIDDTYEPYHESVEKVVGDIRAEQRVLGAKNLCESRCPTSTSKGITFTKNNDGSYTISGVNDGTGGSTIRIDQSSFEGNDNLKTYNGQFIISLLDANGNYVPNTSISLQQMDTWILLLAGDSSNNGIAKGYVNNNKIYTRIAVTQGADFSTPKTVYPMLRLASDPDDTYAPYAMTNKELTEELTEVIDGSSGITSTGMLDNDYLVLKRIGQEVFCQLRVNGTFATGATLALLPEGFRPKKRITAVGNISTKGLVYVDISEYGIINCGGQAVSNENFTLLYTSWRIN